MVHARLLRYLDEVARSGSIRQAAERLNVASSAINRQILDLEAEIGVSLFKRFPRGLRPTPAGEFLIAHARQTLKGFDHVLEQMLDVEAVRSGTVHVAAMHGPTHGVVPMAGTNFRDKYPNITINVTVGGSKEIIRLVDDGMVDLGLSYDLPAYHGLQTIRSLTTELGAVVSVNHPLANRKSVTLADCLAYPIVAPTVEVSIRHLINAALRERAAAITPAFESNSTAFLLNLVQDGRHLTFMNPADTTFSATARLVFLPVADITFPKHTLVLARKKGSQLSTAAELLASELSRLFDKMSKKTMIRRSRSHAIISR